LYFEKYLMESFMFEQIDPAGEGSGTKIAGEDLRGRSNWRGERIMISLGIIRMKSYVGSQLLPSSKEEVWTQVAPVEISQVGRHFRADQNSTVG
jgi:hypothetical protein